MAKLYERIADVVRPYLREKLDERLCRAIRALVARELERAGVAPPGTYVEAAPSVDDPGYLGLYWFDRHGVLLPVTEVEKLLEAEVPAEA